MALTRLNNRSVSAVTTLPSAATSQFLTGTHVQQVTGTQNGFSVSYTGGTWQNLASVNITPQNIGNIITIDASFVYPKEATNFTNVNSYRIKFGNTTVDMVSESFQYSDPWTHQNMTGLGHHSYSFIVDSSTVGVQQNCAIQWQNGNSGSYGIGVYLTQGIDIACRITAIERR
jgi:hypothetical protein